MFEKQKLNISHSALLHMKTRVSLNILWNIYLWKLIFVSGWVQTALNLISLVISVKLTPLTQF